MKRQLPRAFDPDTKPGGRNVLVRAQEEKPPRRGAKQSVSSKKASCQTGRSVHRSQVAQDSTKLRGST
jgi:hypothetical protein